jgi:RNA methyltransferase, TrmH family
MRSSVCAWPSRMLSSARTTDTPSAVPPAALRIRLTLKKITSRDNPDYRRLLRLASSGRTRRSLGQILLDGEHLIDAYAQAYGTRALSLVIRSSSLEREEVQRRLAAASACLVIADGLFNELSPVDTPTGILAAAAMPGPRVPATGGFAVLIDGVQDPANLGAILRSAAAAGAAFVVLSRQCADVWSPKCLRGGMGAQFVLAIQEQQDLPSVIGTVPGKLVAADPHAETSLYEAELADPVAFVVGGEGRGVSPEVLALSTQRVRIPMASGIESLNAAAAATLLFYEWRRRADAAGLESVSERGERTR